MVKDKVKTHRRPRGSGRGGAHLSLYVRPSTAAALRALAVLDNTSMATVADSILGRGCAWRLSRARRAAAKQKNKNK